jgi:twin BRCT domain
LFDLCFYFALCRDAVTSRTSSGPAFLSPWWVVHSCRDGKLLPCSNNYIPECRCAIAIKKQKLVATTERTTGHRPVVAPIFRGSVFVLLRVVPPAWAVDFDSIELETVIAQHGGQMLSHALLDALKADQAAAAATTTTQQRTCYVVCWGGPSTHDLHPLLSQVKRYQLCDVQPVTPIWLQTCATEQKCIHPSRLPELFQPNNRPIHSFSKHQYGKGEKQVDAGSSIRISLTGFSGSQRTAMIRLIAAMRGIYDDSMRTATTHLICREAGVGQKYEKAVEWKLHIVTCAWLYHVARYGFDGEPPSEERFAVAPPPTSHQQHTMQQGEPLSKSCSINLVPCFITLVY